MGSDAISTFIQSGTDPLVTGVRERLGYPTRTSHPRLWDKLVKIFLECEHSKTKYHQTALRMSLAWQAGVRVASFTYAIKSLMGKVSGKENEALHHLYSYMQNKVDFDSEEFIPEGRPDPFVKVYVSFNRRK